MDALHPCVHALGAAGNFCFLQLLHMGGNNGLLLFLYLLICENRLRAVSTLKYCKVRLHEKIIALVGFH